MSDYRLGLPTLTSVRLPYQINYPWFNSISSFRNFQWLYIAHITKFKFLSLADKAPYNLAKLIVRSDYPQMQQKSIPLILPWAHLAFCYLDHTAFPSRKLPIHTTSLEFLPSETIFNHILATIIQSEINYEYLLNMGLLKYNIIPIIWYLGSIKNNQVISVSHLKSWTEVICIMDY